MLKIFERIKEWSDSRGISKQEVSNNDWELVISMVRATYGKLEARGVKGYPLYKLEELEEYAVAMNIGDINGAIDAIADSTIFDTTEMIKYGCDIELTLNEVLNVVESRTGVWNDKIDKFIKDKSPQAQALWYEPDYVKNCKAKVERTGSLFGHDRVSANGCGCCN